MTKNTNVKKKKTKKENPPKLVISDDLAKFIPPISRMGGSAPYGWGFGGIQPQQSANNGSENSNAQ
ncbi:hypothetical protein LJC19_04515 [Oxalobacter sp. OttesenSCG-928-P03]|nr:hypothetical protein [Oxalobacter sp. OttesenSCG-928-P03]